MTLDADQRAFIRQRRAALRRWPAMALTAGALLFGVAGWLLLRHPLLINPLEVQRHLAAGTLDGGSAALLASLMPLTLDVCLVVAVVALLLASVGFRNERRLIEALDSLGATEAAGPGGGGH